MTMIAFGALALVLLAWLAQVTVVHVRRQRRRTERRERHALIAREWNLLKPDLSPRSSAHRGPLAGRADD